MLHVIGILVLSVQGAFAQFKTNIPLDKNVTTGKLKNGLTYYILYNEELKDRASFYFVQNVGAIFEDDNQNGLAYFLEHMAFNGTEHFKGKGIIKMLEKNGVSFGKDINAYTAQDETVYNISTVPVRNEKLIDSTLWVLYDWSGSLSLTDAEIDAERGVIREEWRTRRTSDFRLKMQTDPVLYKGSKYSKRDVIGDLNIINNFKYPELRNYYKKWYRPDLQAAYHLVPGFIHITLHYLKYHNNTHIPFAFVVKNGYSFQNSKYPDFTNTASPYNN